MARFPPFRRIEHPANRLRRRVTRSRDREPVRGEFGRGLKMAIDTVHAEKRLPVARHYSLTPTVFSNWRACPRRWSKNRTVAVSSTGRGPPVDTLERQNFSRAN